MVRHMGGEVEAASRAMHTAAVVPCVAAPTAREATPAKAVVVVVLSAMTASTPHAVE